MTVADEQSFTRAAELGVDLFERGARPLKLTEPGRFFYEHADLALMRELIDQIYVDMGLPARFGTTPA